MRLSLALFAALLLAGWSALPAQDICVPPKDSHEANTFATLSVPLAFTGARAPAVAHGISIGLEFASIPSVGRTNATPTACRPDKGPENTNPIPGIIRPRIAVAMHGLVFEASWIPPVSVDEVRANLFGLAIAHPHPWVTAGSSACVLTPYWVRCEHRSPARTRPCATRRASVLAARGRTTGGNRGYLEPKR